jgi:hypothetical protein
MGPISLRLIGGEGNRINHSRVELYDLNRELSGMKSILACASLSLILVGATGSVEAKGCIKGALVGGIAGHVAGHHGLVGAAAGCAIGHHDASKNAEPNKQQQ